MSNGIAINQPNIISHSARDLDDSERVNFKFFKNRIYTFLYYLYYIFIIFIIIFIGTAVSVGVFSHILKIDDAIVGIMSSMSKILAGFVYAFAITDWMIYLGKYSHKN